MKSQSSLHGAPRFYLTRLSIFSLAFVITGIATTSSRYTLAKSQSEARQEAFLLEKQGRERFVQKDFTAAIKLWRQAYDTYQDNKLLFFIASTYGRLKGECELESKAWNAYLSACQEGACPNKERGQKGHQKFRSRCFQEVNISSNAANASISSRERTWGSLPLKKSLLVKRYEDLKVSSPGYLSRRLDLDLSDTNTQRSVRVNLTLIPKETFFEKHQLKIALSTAIISVSMLSLGALQLSSANALSDEEERRNYPDAFESLEAQREARALYESNKSNYNSDHLWGSILLTTGVIGLGASAWMLLYKGPNAAIHERAREQGDLISWGLEPKYSIQGNIDGARAWWRLDF